MAAQYDVNLEKCALLKFCVEARLLQDRLRAFTCSYISVILGHTDKSSLIHLSNL